MKTLWKWLVAVDRILRGDATRVYDLRDGSIQIPTAGVTFWLLILGMLYGVCMSVYVVFNFEHYEQMLASAVKVPALFVLTLVVTLPSLYVFNALVGSRLTARALLRLFVASLAVNLAVLASLGPIVAFFSVNTTSYSFMVLLNVLVFSVAGLLSVTFLLQTLHRLNIAPRMAPPTERRELTPGDEPEQPAELRSADVGGPLDTVEGTVFGGSVKFVFFCWMLLFGVVGAQMSWILRPFIGSPKEPFAWFRPHGSNFFEAVYKSIVGLLGL